MELITGIPPSAQDVRIRGLSGDWVVVEGDERLLGEQGTEWRDGLRRGGEMEVCVPLHLRSLLLDCSQRRDVFLSVLEKRMQGDYPQNGTVSTEINSTKDGQSLLFK